MLFFPKQNNIFTASIKMHESIKLWNTIDRQTHQIHKHTFYLPTYIYIYYIIHYIYNIYIYIIHIYKYIYLYYIYIKKYYILKT